MSFAETLSSLGVMMGILMLILYLGPLFGSILYAFGGYTTPFLFFGSLSTLMAIIVGVLFEKNDISS